VVVQDWTKFDALGRWDVKTFGRWDVKTLGRWDIHWKVETLDVGTLLDIGAHGDVGLDLPDVVSDEFWVMELVVPVCRALKQLVVVVILSEALKRERTCGHTDIRTYGHTDIRTCGHMDIRTFNRIIGRNMFGLVLLIRFTYCNVEEMLPSFPVVLVGVFLHDGQFAGVELDALLKICLS
jgi:hypothetical protein